MDARKMKRNRASVMHKMTIRLPEDVYKGMKQECDSRCITIASYMNELVQSDEQKHLRDLILKVKTPVYEIVFSDDAMKTLTDVTGMFEGMIGKMQKWGQFLSYYISKWREGYFQDPDDGYDMSGKFTSHSDILNSVARAFIDSQDELYDAAKLMQRVYKSADTVYVYDYRKYSSDGGRSKAEDGGLVRTVVRIPERDMKEIRAFCGVLHMALTEYFALLADGDKGTARIKTKVRIAQKVRRIYVSDECNETAQKFVNSMNKVMRQVSIVDSNVDAFLRDVRSGVLQIPPEKVVLKASGKDMSISGYMKRLNTISDGCMKNLTYVSKEYLKILKNDPRARESAGRCLVIARENWSGTPEQFDDIIDDLEAE